MPHLGSSSLARLGARCFALGIVCCAVGCDEEKPPSIFDEVSQLPKQEELVEVDLGVYSVPVPVVIGAATTAAAPANLLQLEFQLFGLVNPNAVGEVDRLLRRNRGRVRDRVITVCRQTPREDLADAQWSTLKAHLLDALQPMLGGPALRRVGVSRVNKDEL